MAIGWILKGTGVGLWLGGLGFWAFGGLLGAFGLGLMHGGVVSYAAGAALMIWRRR